MKRFAGFLLLVLTASPVVSEEFTFPQGWEIHGPPDPTPSERFAEEELEKYLQMLPGNGPEGSHRIVLRKTGSLATPDEARLGQDNYRIRVTPEETMLEGVNDRALLYAVYDFLGQFGYRWVMPGPLGETPAKTRLLAVQERTERPAFFLRELCTSGGEAWSNADTVAWQVRNRLNRDFNLRREEAWTTRGGSPQWHWIAHNYKFVLPEEEGWFERHPEWFALYKGRRMLLGNEQGNVCTTNPGLIQHFVERIREWFDANPEGSVFPLSPPDGAIRWCEDEACMALGGQNFTPGPEGSMSRRQIRFVGTIAEEIAKTHPDRKVLLLAYQNYVDPVPGESLPPNVIVKVVNYGAFGQPMTEEVNQLQRERFEGWARIAAPGSGSPGVWDYCLLQVDGLSGSRWMPMPVARALHENLQFMHNLGGRVFFTQAGPVQESNPFPFYAAARWAWDPDEPFEDVLNDFCGAAFGPAAAPMAAYIRLLEDAARTSGWNPPVWPGITTPDARLLTPEVLAGLGAHLAEAERLVPEGPYAERLRGIRKSLDHATSTVAQSKPWRLRRGRDSYVINADGGREAEHQARGLEAEKKNSGDPDGSLTRLIFRIHPREAAVLHLETPAASVAVIPEIGGRIVRFVDAKTGWNLFDEPEEDLVLESPGAAYVHYGGYEEYGGAAFASPGWEMPFRRARSDGGLRLLGGSGTLDFEREILLDPVRPRLTIRSHLLSPGDGRVLRAHPVLRLPDPLEELTLVWRDSSGGIQRRALTHGSPEGVAGWWGVYSPRLQMLLTHSFGPEAETHLHLDHEQNFFNLELFSPSGTEVRLEQHFEIHHGSLEETLARAADSKSL